MATDFAASRKSIMGTTSVVLLSLLGLALVAEPGVALAKGNKVKPRPHTCLVLSGGAADGIAHIGAIKALQKAGVEIDCVAGTSIGALVGALHASDPDEDVGLLFRDMITQYKALTEEEAKRRGSDAALLTGLLVLASGGTMAAALELGSVGYSVGARGVDKLELDRLAKVLDRSLEHARFSDLPVKLMTFHLKTTTTGARLKAVTAGSVAQAVKKSIANPLLFDEFDATKEGYLDPGVDRMAMIPIQDVCRRLPGSRIIAINVSGERAIYDSKLPCSVLEVRVRPSGASFEDAVGSAKVWKKLTAAGYNATVKALRKAGGKKLAWK